MEVALNGFWEFGPASSMLSEDDVTITDTLEDGNRRNRDIVSPPRMRGRSAMPRSDSKKRVDRSKGRSKSRTRSKSRARSKSREPVEGPIQNPSNVKKTQPAPGGGKADAFARERSESKVASHRSSSTPSRQRSNLRASMKKSVEDEEIGIMIFEARKAEDGAVPTSSSMWESSIASMGRFGTSVGATINNEIWKFGDYLSNDKGDIPIQKMTKALDTRAKSPYRKPLTYDKHKKKMPRSTSFQNKKASTPDNAPKDKASSNAESSTLKSQKSFPSETRVSTPAKLIRETTQEGQEPVAEKNPLAEYEPKALTDVPSTNSNASSATTIQITNKTAGNQPPIDAAPPKSRPRNFLMSFRRKKSSSTKLFGSGRAITASPSSKDDLVTIVGSKTHTMKPAPLETKASMSIAPSRHTKRTVSSDNLPKGSIHSICIDTVKEILSNSGSSVQVFEPNKAAGLNTPVTSRQRLKATSAANLQKWLRFAQQRISLHQKTDDAPILKSTSTLSSMEGIPKHSRSTSQKKPTTKAPPGIVRAVPHRTTAKKETEKNKKVSAITTFKKKGSEKTSSELERKMVQYLATFNYPTSMSQY